MDDQNQLSAQQRRPSMATPAHPGNLNDSPTHLLPSNSADTLADSQLPHIPTPRDMQLAPPGGLSSNLDFLADISMHQNRTEPELNSMMMGDQQPYFGWGSVPALNPADQDVSQRSMAFDAVPNEMMQLWLEPRADSISHNSSNDYMRDPAMSFMGDGFLPPGRRSSHSIDMARFGDSIPNERFARVERCWFAPSPLVGRLINSLWRDISCFDCDNLFDVSAYQSLNSFTDSCPETRFGLNDECRLRLQTVFGLTQTSTSGFGVSTADAAVSPAASSTSGSIPAFPPAEILDMVLDLYFRHFHPLVPFVHIPTFCARTTRTSLLFVMCQIGMTILGTKGSTSFVMKTFPYILEKVSSELSKCAVGSATPASVMSTFAAAFLMLNLAAMTGVSNT